MTRYNEPLVDPVEALRAEVIALVHAALPLTDLSQEWASEFQVKRGDGGWHGVEPRQAISAHQQRLPVRSRKVTPWQEVDVPGLSSVSELRAAG